LLINKQSLSLAEIIMRRNNMSDPKEQLSKEYQALLTSGVIITHTDKGDIHLNYADATHNIQRSIAENLSKFYSVSKEEKSATIYKNFLPQLINSNDPYIKSYQILLTAGVIIKHVDDGLRLDYANATSYIKQPIIDNLHKFYGVSKEETHATVDKGFLLKLEAQAKATQPTSTLTSPSLSHGQKHDQGPTKR
jgi:hypothetical protein